MNILLVGGPKSWETLWFDQQQEAPTIFAFRKSFADNLWRPVYGQLAARWINAYRDRVHRYTLRTLGTCLGNEPLLGKAHLVYGSEELDLFGVHCALKQKAEEVLRDRLLSNSLAGAFGEQVVAEARRRGLV